MSGPARAGLFIYARQLERLSGFYQSVLEMTRAHRTPDLIVLRSPDMQIVVSAMPARSSEGSDGGTPPAVRDRAAYKFFFTVSSLARARETVSSLGGEMLPDQYRGTGFVAHNVIDPEGNIFQLREIEP